MKFNLIFPMAGEGVRFGRKFKPFLTFGTKTFIENAVEPFIKHKQHINKVVFIVTTDQAATYDVKAKIQDMFGDILDCEVVAIPETKNQYETVSIGTAFLQESGLIDSDTPIIVCDCDHRVNVDPLIESIYRVPTARNRSRIIVPVWRVELNEVKHWGIFHKSANGAVCLMEKKLPHYVGSDDLLFGVIGCIYFDHKSLFDPKIHELKYTSITSAINDNSCMYNIHYAEILEAYFFGDKEKLTTLEQERAELIQGGEVREKLVGGSLARVNVVQLSGGVKAVRKQIQYDGASVVFDKLKQQYKKLKMLNSLNSELFVKPLYEFTPEAIGGSYGYDMEYLDGFRQLNTFGPQVQMDQLEKVSNELFSVYASSQVTREEPDLFWLDNHLDVKIWPKLNTLSQSSYTLNLIINRLGTGIRDILNSLDLTQFSPKNLSIYHGDLSLSNIMHNPETGRTVLIDCDNGDYGTPLLDLGKIAQSLLGQYEKWCFDPHPSHTFPELTSEGFAIFCRVCQLWSVGLNLPYITVFNAARFYCGLHFIRMIPFRMETSEDSGAFAASLARTILLDLLGDASVRKRER